MDQNFDGTRNPLNPNPKPNPEPRPEPNLEPRSEARPEPSFDTKPGPTPRMAAERTKPLPTQRAFQASAERAPRIPVKPAPQTFKTEMTAQPPLTTDQAAPLSSPQIVAPNAAAPQAQVTEVKSEHKILKKKALIIGGILAVFIAVGCGVVAALMLIIPPKDPVASAIQKLLEGGYNTNIAIEGKIDVDIKPEKYPFSKLGIDLDAQIVGGSTINSTNATVTANLRGSENTVKLDIDSVHAQDDNSYLKISGTKNFYKAYTNLTRSETTDKSSDEAKTASDEVDSSTTNDESTPDSALASFITALSETDGKWIKMAKPDLSGLPDQVNGDKSVNCAKSVAEKLASNKNNIAMLYQNNPFIMSTSDKIPIASKDHQLRRIILDREKFTNFIESFNDLDVNNYFAECDNQEAIEIDIDNIVQMVSDLPPIYVEVDDEFRFTRLYIYQEIDAATIEADFSISYPDNLNITEPSDYIEYDTYLELLSKNNQSTSENSDL